MKIEGSAAIVVGGASGLGEASARALHERLHLPVERTLLLRQLLELSEQLGKPRRRLRCPRPLAIARERRRRLAERRRGFVDMP